MAKVNPNTKGVNKISNYLIDNGIKFVREKKFPTLKSTRNYPLPFDFFLPDLNILIEFDGKQHFIPTNFFGGEEGFRRLRHNDRTKNGFVRRSESLKLLRIPYKQMNSIECILHSYITRKNAAKVKIVENELDRDNWYCKF